jgi:hypothetical protein
VAPTDRFAHLFSLPIRQLMQSQPQLARLFILNRMACPGCDFSQFHTLDQALEIYTLCRDSFQLTFDDGARSTSDHSDAWNSTFSKEDE